MLVTWPYGLLGAAGAKIPKNEYLKVETNECHPIAHHMGGCRMGPMHTRAYVDRNLRSHNFRNLFIVGSSVFPTGSAISFTLTIVALALRAAREIGSGFRGRPLIGITARRIPRASIDNTKRTNNPKRGTGLTISCG